jgi:hypothetical protein
LIGWLFYAGHCRKRFNRYLRKFPDGTVIWTSPSGQTYVTIPGSALLFPSLCAPTEDLPARQPASRQPTAALSAS